MEYTNQFTKSINNELLLFDQIMLPGVNAEQKMRNIQLDGYRPFNLFDPASVTKNSAFTDSFKKPRLIREVSNGYNKSAIIDEKEKQQQQLQEQEQQVNTSLHVVPETPFYLVETNMKVNQNIDDLVQSISSCLFNMIDVAYEFDVSRYEWKAMYMHNLASSSFQVHVYNEGSDNYIVEAHRVEGDVKAFKALYGELKNNITAAVTARLESSSITVQLSTILPVLVAAAADLSLSASIPMNQFSVLTDDGKFTEKQVHMDSIMYLYNQNTHEAQLEVSRIIYFLSSDETIHHQLSSNNCIVLLAALLRSCYTVVTQNAVFSLANLSSSPVCQLAIIEAGVMSDILDLIADAPYHSTEVRRECARIVANISSRRACKVIDVIGKVILSAWFSKVDSLIDPKLKINAVRARNYLSSAITSN